MGWEWHGARYPITCLRALNNHFIAAGCSDGSILIVQHKSKLERDQEPVKLLNGSIVDIAWLPGINTIVVGGGHPQSST